MIKKINKAIWRSYNGEVIILTILLDEDRILEKILEGLSEGALVTMNSNTSAPDLSYSGLQINSHQRKVRQNNVEIELTNREFDLLLYLFQQPGRVFTKEQIYQHLYPDEPTGEIDNIIYCLIRGLRKKLEPDSQHPKYIHTVRGVGYKFQPLSEE